MEHLTIVENGSPTSRLRVKASGEYFTPEIVGRRLARDVLVNLPRSQARAIRVIDPFAGDGRLVAWLIEEATRATSPFRSATWEISLWDISESNVQSASARVTAAASRAGVRAKISAVVADTFQRAKNFAGMFDLVLTNPPWEHLKPDRRELADLIGDTAAQYVAALRVLATRLVSDFPHSAPGRPFSGWGVNMSRMGLEASMGLVGSGGVLGILMPASFLADHSSVQLREWLFDQHQCIRISYYPAEASLFEEADQPFSVLVLRAAPPRGETSITAYDEELRPRSTARLNVRASWLRDIGYCIPASLDAEQMLVFQALQKQPKAADVEGRRPGEVWIGRELDETGLARFVSSRGTRRFLKGRYVDRYTLRTGLEPLFLVPRRVGALPPSVKFARLVWRDVSRPNQKRRMHAAVIGPGDVTGNSLGVLHDWQQESDHLLWLLGVFSSLSFEYQIRSLLSTGHISAGVIRRAALPGQATKLVFREVVRAVRRRVSGDITAEPEIEVLVARSYGLGREDFRVLLNLFSKLPEDEKVPLLNSPLWKR